MVANGIEQWRPDHTLARRVEDAWCEGETLVLPGGGGLAGSVSVFWDDRLAWGDEGDDGRAGYIHLLVGRSHGRDLLDAAERLIVERARPLARLDCVVSGAYLRHFYEAAGYRYVRDTNFGGREDIPLCRLYEKPLTGPPGPTA